MRDVHASHSATSTFNQIDLFTSKADRPRTRTVTCNTFAKLYPSDNPITRVTRPPTNEDLSDERNGKNRKPMHKKGTRPELHNAAGFSDLRDPNASPLSVIQTGVILTMPYTRFGGPDSSVRSHFRRVYRVITIINLASRCISFWKRTVRLRARTQHSFRVRTETGRGSESIRIKGNAFRNIEESARCKIVERKWGVRVIVVSIVCGPAYMQRKWIV